MEDQINREDTKIMQEIADFLADYDFTCGDFIDFMLKMEEEVETVHSGEVHLDRGNCYQYFNGRPVPMVNLLKIRRYLSCFEWELDENDSRLEQYRERADTIGYDIIDYIVKNRNTAKNILAEMRDVLSGMDDTEINSLFQSLYVFSMPERLWTFWACYSCLDYMAQAAIMEKLSSFPVPPAVYADNLYRFHTWEMEVNVPFRTEFEKRYEKYQAQKANGTGDRKKFIEALVKMLQKYPYVFRDTVYYFAERATQRPEPSDWPVLTAYWLMCSALDKVEQAEIDRSIREYLKDEGNWRVLTKINWDEVNWNALPKIEKVPKEVIHYYAGWFHECNAE